MFLAHSKTPYIISFYVSQPRPGTKNIADLCFTKAGMGSWQV